jgi:3',5'-cyclic AMP phosphodiesterase CpdA
MAAAMRILHGCRTHLRVLLAVVLVGIGWPGNSGARPTDAASPLRVIVISDLNESYGSTYYSADVTRAVARIISLRPALVINTGDMVAGQRLQPPLARSEIEGMWSAFHQAVTEPLTRAGLPMAVTPGNHDASSGQRFTLEREIYRQQWQARRPQVEFVDSGDYPFSYAFAVGRVLFVSLDATFVGPLSQRERNWLRTVLERHGERFSHRVVFSHVPLWPVAIGRERDYLGDERLEADLRSGRVDLYLSGHHHAYYPGAKDGVRYVSQACLGAAPRPLIGSAAATGRAITVLEIPAQGRISVEAYRAPDFVETIPRHELPDQVKSRVATLIRDDLAPSQPTGQSR